MNWRDYFAMMEDWKQLPAYKAEPRVDSLIGFYLQDMAGDFFKDKIVGIIPELPIRLATVKPYLKDKEYADRSYKVDFYLQGTSGMNYFVEFKTDSSSRREKQDTYLDEAKDKGMAAIIAGIATIAEVSSYKKKYGHLLAKLRAMGLMNSDGQFSGKDDTITIVYAQPRRKDEDKGIVIDFDWMSKWLTAKNGRNDFEAALANALSHWARD